MIKVTKASAGSGKTYTLAKTYISLLRKELDYRHILAVTFTNKATAEMKERILKYLSEDPAQKDKLTEILHDYSAFSVSTIDKFFQRALKAFAREIGQVADYQVELDRDSVITEAMDRILDSLTADEAQKEILGWLRENVSDKLESGASPNVEGSLYDMGKRLRSDERMALRRAHGIGDEEFDKKRLLKIRSSCQEIIKKFAADVKAGAEALGTMNGNNAEKQRLGYTNTVWYKDIEFPKASLQKEAEGTPFMDLFGKPYRIYRTARIIEPQVFSLGLAREFFARFEEILKEKNILCLDDGNTLLSRIIAGSDAPFVYEKLGVRYEHFLLDEFQDTSGVQWENFLPLLRESDSAGHESLIVGDVKQSIYRWRDSDWRLLAEKVEQEFPSACVDSRKENRRSCREIVEFNSEFFLYAARNLSLDKLYADVQQEVLSDDTQGGYVRVSFCEKEKEAEMVVSSVEAALAAGARYEDIAVLVRNNAEGGALAAELLSAGHPVVSDDSLKVSSSFIVRKVVSLLGCIDNPEDTINDFISSDAGVCIPQQYHSLVDLCEQILRGLKAGYPDVFRDETLFIQAFMDTIREWSEVNGNNLRYFLQSWEEDKRCISSPQNSNAITVLTIHKSKGLEFPYMVFPYAEKVSLYKPNERWCWLDAAGTPFDPAVTGIYSVELNQKSGESLFSDYYVQEQQMQKVDGTNLFYVALTRARCCLHIIACNPPKTRTEGTFKDYSQLLYDFCGGQAESSRGTMYDFSRLRRKPSEGTLDFPAGYVTIEPGDRLRVSQDAADFFGPEGATGMDASARRSGIVIHSILAGIKSPEDLPGAIEDAVQDGRLDKTHAASVRELLEEKIASHPAFFKGGGNNEAAVFDADGSEYRPDRVVLSRDSALVIDYKFGAREDKYRRQVRRYMDLYRKLGYKKVEGLLWYVPEDEVEPVQ